MTEKKKFEKKPTFTTPPGRFKYPRLNEPDTKFKAEGEYSVSLVFEPDAPGVQAMIDMADKGAAEILAETKKAESTPAKAKKWESKYLPYKMEVDDEEEETGNIEFKFTMKASGVSKKTGKPWKRKPAVFDSKGKPLPADVNVWGGTIGKIAYQVIPYAPTPQVGASVKFALEAAKIIDLVSGGEKDAGAYGFGEEEDGYDAPAASEQDDTDDNADDDQGDF